MFILDTDLLTVIQRRSEPAYSSLYARLRYTPPGEVCITIVEESWAEERKTYADDSHLFVSGVPFGRHTLVGGRREGKCKQRCGAESRMALGRRDHARMERGEPDSAVANWLLIG